MNSNDTADQGVELEQCWGSSDSTIGGSSKVASAASSCSDAINSSIAIVRYFGNERSVLVIEAPKGINEFAVGLVMIALNSLMMQVVRNSFQDNMRIRYECWGEPKIIRTPKAHR